MIAAKEPKAAPAPEREDDERHDALADADAAERAYALALQTWRSAREREDRLRRTGRADDTAPVLDEVDRVVAIDEAEQATLAAARQLGRARARLHAARVEAASAELPELVARHGEAAERVAKRRRALDAAAARLVVVAWWFREAVEDEVGEARAIVRVAQRAARNDEEREAIVHVARGGELPSELGPDGPTAFARRPELGLFDGTQDPLLASTWTSYGEAIAAGPRRAQLGKHVREAVERERERIEKTKRGKR